MNTLKIVYILHFSETKKIPCTLEEIVELSSVFENDIILIESLETNGMFKGTIEDYFNKTVSLQNNIEY